MSTSTFTRSLFASILAVGLAGCGDDAGLTPRARLNLGGQHELEIFELPDGEFAFRETGASGESNPLSPQQLQEALPAGLYQKFAALDDARVPQSLLDAQMRPPRGLGSANARPALPAEPRGDNAFEPIDARLAGSPITADPAWDWDADARWWDENFCAKSQVDGVWCPTNVSWAHGGWQPSMYYEATGLAAGFSSSASFWIEEWTGTGWTRIINTTLSPRHWARWWFPRTSTFRAGIDGGTADPRVHLAVRLRQAFPDFAQIDSFPRDVDYNFSNDLQGVTHDANNWYLTRTKYGVSEPEYGVIAKVALGTSLANEPSLRYRTPDAWRAAGYDHYGDLVQVGGLIYVAMDGPRASRAAVGVFDTELRYIGYAELPGLASVPFIAHNPADGLFATVTDSAPSTLKRFRIGLSGSSVSATAVADLALSQPIQGGLQGGKFSAKGNLYVAVGVQRGPGPGVYMIDGFNGVVHRFLSVPYAGTDEMEGLDLWDLDADTRGPGIRGQLHLLQIDNDTLDDDDLYFLHFRASDVGRL